MQQIARQQQHLAQVRRKQGEIVRGKGAKEPIANMRILHGCHWLTPAIARRHSMRYWARAWAKAFGPAPCAVSILDLRCGNPRSRRTTRRSRDRARRYGCRRLKARFRNAVRCAWFPTISSAGRGAEGASISRRVESIPQKKPRQGGASVETKRGIVRNPRAGVCSKGCRN